MSKILLLLILLCSPPALAQEPPAGIALDQPESAPAEAPAEPVIALTNDDEAIAARLRGLFSELSGLEQVRAEVRSGVVSLSGTTLTTEDRQRAEAIAGRLAGVASVENQIEIEQNVGKRLQPVAEQGRQLADDVRGFLPLLGIGLLVFGFFWLLGYLLTRKSGIFGKLAPNPLVRALIGQVIQLAFILVGLVLAMRILGATALLGSVLGAAGVLGLAVGFALRDTIENYIASILLSIRRPFAPNDLVLIDGSEGHVTRLNSRATVLTSLAGNEIRIPNAVVYKANIENYTAIPERRFEFTVGIGYENDLCSAMAVAHEAALGASGVLADPEPVILADTLGDSTITLKILAWMNQSVSDFGKTRSAAIRAVKEGFEREGVSMPEPTFNYRFLSDSAEPEDGESIHPRKRDTEAVTDTSPDRTIEGKVSAIRSGDQEDLLTPQAPRE